MNLATFFEKFDLFAEAGALAAERRHINSMGRKPQVDQPPSDPRHSVAIAPYSASNLGLPQAMKFRHSVAARLRKWTRDAERAA